MMEPPNVYPVALPLFPGGFLECAMPDDWESVCDSIDDYQLIFKTIGSSDLNPLTFPGSDDCGDDCGDEEPSLIFYRYDTAMFECYLCRELQTFANCYHPEGGEGICESCYKETFGYQEAFAHCEVRDICWLPKPLRIVGLNQVVFINDFVAVSDYLAVHPKVVQLPDGNWKPNAHFGFVITHRLVGLAVAQARTERAAIDAAHFLSGAWDGWASITRRLSPPPDELVEAFTDALELFDIEPCGEDFGNVDIEL
jgi:hypothetical protein